MPNPFFIAASGEGQAHQILIYDVIGESFWEAGVTSKQIIAALDTAGGGDVDVRINSNGGDHKEGTAIYNALANHSGTVTVRIEGYACSMATVIACAADTVEMYETGLMMVHKASTSAWGNADELRAAAEMLDKADSTIVTAYTRKTGKSEDDIRAVLDEKRDTWLTAEEAADLGIVDSVVVPDKFNVLQDKAAAKALAADEGAVLLKPGMVPKAVRAELAGVPGVMAYAVEPDQIRALKPQASGQDDPPADPPPADDPPPQPQPQPQPQPEPETETAEQIAAKAQEAEKARIRAIMAMAAKNNVPSDGQLVQGLIVSGATEKDAGAQIMAVAQAISEGLGAAPPQPQQQPEANSGWGAAYKAQGVKIK